MDWKNNIIAQTPCHAQAVQFKAYAGEDFLVTLANKGLYKRALKDLEGTVQIEITGSEPFTIKLDDATVTLNENISQSTCSCPSKTVCKHVIMAILAASEYASVSDEAEPPVTEPSVTEPSITEPWQELKKADITVLRKQAGKKLFEDTLKLIQDGWAADFAEGEMLEATINTENITVYFPAQDSLNRAICKCGNAGLCKHKLIAILSYLSRQNMLGESVEDNTPVSLITDETRKIMEAADRFVIHALEKGIISCGEKEAETAIQFSIHMESCGIGNLARMFRSLSSDLENMLAKHIGFNQITTFGRLSRLHNTMRLILNNTNDQQLLGQLIEGTRSDYYTTPIGTFTGLGAYPWQTRSDYFGITAYFYYHEKQTICTFTSSMAGYYENTEQLANLPNLTRQYQRNDHWASNQSLSTLSLSTFTLRNFKLNRQNRLSSSSQTQCELTGKVTRDAILNTDDLKPLFDLATSENDRYNYFGKKTADHVVLIPFQDFANINFNHTEQVLYFSVETKENGDITGQLEYNEITKEAIKRMERMAKLPDHNMRLMVCLKRLGVLTPVSFISDKGVENFFFSYI